VAEETRVNGCCSGLFFAEVAQDEPRRLLLECCLCGRAWRQESDGALTPCSEQPLWLLHRTQKSQSR
jgi:hypothetical protein